ncbi:MAG TPA: hypothetical protein VGN17_24730 [Bryobacteraceae bacterium]
MWPLDRELVRLRLLAISLTLGLIEGGGTTPQESCEGIAEEEPELWEKFGSERVLRLCEQAQRSELPEESARLQELFQEFNQRYFARTLPNYTVRLVVDVSYWRGWETGLSKSFVDFQHQVITLGYVNESKNLSELLCHMVRIAHPDCNYLEPAFLKEIERLRAMGAPVDLKDIRLAKGKYLVQ